MNKQIYLAGGMLTKGEQMLRNAEKEDIKKIGLEMYVPQDNKSINSKEEVDNEGLAERIVKADTDAIYNSDITVVDIHSSNQGTLIEIGQHKGSIDVAKMVLEIATNNEPYEALNRIVELAERIANKVILPHCEDIRRFPNAGADEVGDRRSFSHNAYVYGTVLDLTNGVGFYDWEDVLKELKKIKKSN